MHSHQEAKEWEEVTDEQDERVTIVFEFDFMIFENLDSNQIKECGWEVDSLPTQHIYISSDKNKLLEIVNNTIAIIYEIDTRTDIFEAGFFSHQKVTWKEINHIKRFPTLLQNDISTKFLFSNNFTYFIDFDFEANQIVIMETKT